MDPLAFYDGSRGLCAGFVVESVAAIQDEGLSVRETTLYRCYIAMRLTEACAFHHATSDVAGSFACQVTCLPILESQAAPNTYGTCELNVCLACEAEAHGDEYLNWAGRDMPRSGIIGYITSSSISRPLALLPGQPHREAGSLQPDQDFDGSRT
jgi:hypothetical protein